MTMVRGSDGTKTGWKKNPSGTDRTGTSHSRRTTVIAIVIVTRDAKRGPEGMNPAGSCLMPKEPNEMRRKSESFVSSAMSINIETAERKEAFGIGIGFEKGTLTGRLSVIAITNVIQRLRRIPSGW